MNAFHVRTGCLTYWKIGQHTDPDLLEQGLLQHGHAVSARRTSWQVALRLAMGQNFERPEEMVRPLKNAKVNGYQVTVEERGTNGNCYHNEVIAKVDDTGKVEYITNRISPDLDDLQKLTNEYHEVLTSDAVGEVLSTVLKKLGSVSMAPRLHFIPDSEMEEWAKVKKVVEMSHKDNSLTLIPFEFTADTLRDVSNAVTAEMSELATKLTEELMLNELGERAIKNRITRASEALDKLQAYESIVGSVLADARNYIGIAVTALSHAKGASQAESFADALMAG